MDVKDALVKVTTALPADDSAVTSDPIDTGKTTALGKQVAPMELLITAPALTTAQLADAATMTYDVVMSDNADMSNPTTLQAAVITQTGAGGAGAAAAEYRFKLPTTASRYIAVKATNSADVDASAASVTLEGLF